MSTPGFRRSREHLVAHLDPYEIEIVASLVGQLIELLDDIPGLVIDQLVDSDSPFDQWEAEFAVEETPLPEPTDPVIRRLFPDAYLGDVAASAEFRRYTQDDQRRAKLAAARIMLADLTDAHPTVQVAEPHVEAWLTTLTALRLALAVRLGIDGEPQLTDELATGGDDPRAWLFSVYEWLGWLQETLLSCL